MAKEGQLEGLYMNGKLEEANLRFEAVLTIERSS